MPPVIRWSRCQPGKLVYVRCGLSVMMRSGRHRRISRVMSRRTSRVSSSSPSSRPRKSTRFTPRTSAACRCSRSRTGTSSADVTPRSLDPLLPLVTITYATSRPSLASRATVPPARNSGSSGCAATTITRPLTVRTINLPATGRSSRRCATAARMLEQLHERATARGQRARLVVDDVEVPPDPEPFQAEPGQSPGRDLAADGVGRYEGDAEARDHRLLDRGDHGGQHVDARCGARADHERPSLQSLQLIDHAASTRDRARDAAGVLFEQTSRFGQRHRTAETIEEPDAELTLELEHMLRK